MKTATENQSALRKMRKAAGLTAREVAPKIAEYLGLPSYDLTNIYKAEAEGIQKARILAAYAHVYQQELSDVMEAVGLS